MPDDFKSHEHDGTGSKKIKFENLEIFLEEAIAQPTGGANVDAEARTAINAILLLLRTKGLMK